MRIEFEFEEINFGMEAWFQALDDIVQEYFRAAIKTFVLTAAPLIPVDTGMARGSLLNVARAYTDLQFSVTGRTGAIYNYYGTKMPKGPDSGRKLTTHWFIRGKDKYEFMLETAIFHLNLNDNNIVARVAGTPWNSWKIGLEAATKELAKISSDPRLDPFKFLTRTKHAN